MALSVVLVLLCFLVFLGLLTWTFPEGTRLSDLIKSGSEEGLRGQRDRNLALDIGDFGSQEVVAILSGVRNKVKHRPRGDIAWQDSRAGQQLHHRQGVQTFDDSRATISFGEGHVLSLGENSLVVVKNAGSLTNERKRQRSLVVLNGRLDGRIGPGVDGAPGVEIVASNGESRIRPKAAGSEFAVFTAVVGEDDETTFSVSEGEAEIVSGDQRIVVKANEAVVATRDLEVSAPVALPSPPKLREPANEFSEVFRSRSPAIRFSWHESSGADRYRLTVARDSKFRDVVYQGDLATTEFTHTGLKAGRYFWHVQGVRADAVGFPGASRQLSLTADRQPPKLEVAFPPGLVKVPQLVMKGATDPGTKVFIADEPVEVDSSGRFEHLVSLERGANMIVVEAVDESGNTTYRSELIHARY
jgi:hypothetical protein